jgi:hypothetical protein
MFEAFDEENRTGTGFDLVERIHLISASFSAEAEFGFGQPPIDEERVLLVPHQAANRTALAEKDSYTPGPTTSEDHAT